jgi:enoyl-CoA hydratase/carnithine racemase
MTMIEMNQHGAALRITMNRPQVMNALHPQMCAEINAALDVAERASDLRAVVLTGKGRAFSAGADLQFLRTADNDAVTSFSKGISALAARLEDFRLPVLAALNGITVAGGLELALGCDIIVAHDNVAIGDMHAKYGLFPGGGATVRLARRVGLSQAKLLMLTGETIPAAEARGIGLVDVLVAENDMDAAIRGLAAKFSVKSPLLLKRVKMALNSCLEVPQQLGLRWEADLAELHRHSADHTEGLKAFEEKRAPKFTGT